jgi:hypothetical protein
MKLRTSILILALCAISVGAAAQEGTPKPPPCSGPEYRQFDFWLGEWNVTQKGKPAGTSKISPILGGCVVLEEWKSAKGPYAGKSFNRYDAGTGKWEQFWVDTAGGVLRLSGEYKDGKMVLEGKTSGDQGDVLDKITWYNNDDGTVRQVWEKSKDGGATWNAVFNGLYEKKK